MTEQKGNGWSWDAGKLFCRYWQLGNEQRAEKTVGQYYVRGKEKRE